MADEISNEQEHDHAPATTPSRNATRGASKMAIVIAFIGAAFAAWIIISMNLR